MNYEFRKLRIDEISKLHNVSKWVNEEQLEKEITSGTKDVFVIIDGEKIIGEFTAVYEIDYPNKTIPGVRVYLNAFRVNNEYRNRGLGKRLNEFVLKELEKEGYTEFTLGVEDDNYNALHIYSQSGFNEIIGRESETVGDRSYEYNLLLRKIK